MDSAANIRADLQGSYLYKEHPKRPMQDPLSFRDSAMTHGTAQDALANLRKNLLIHVNHQDDNPATVLNATLDDAGNAFLAKRYSINPGKDKNSPSGLVLANANFDPLIWVTDIERLAIAFSHISRASAQRVLKLAADRFTGLPRNLAPDNANIGYLTIQKTASLLDAEIRALSMPVSVDVLPLSGEIEDMGTNAALVTERLNGQMDRLYAMFAVEMLHSTRAFGLRKRDDASLTLGKGTQRLFDKVNALVPAVGNDRIQGPDIESVAAALAGKK
jgi:histidine ammonia-lyase